MWRSALTSNGPFPLWLDELFHGGPPDFIHYLWSETDVTIDQFTERIWGSLVWPDTVPPLLKVTDVTTGKVVETRDELLAAYPFRKGVIWPTNQTISNHPSNLPHLVAAT